MDDRNAQRYAYLTASYIKDLPQVVQLRASLIARGDDTPHYVVVHSEDHAAFAEALASDAPVVLKKTSEYLPAFYEHWRMRSVAKRKPPKFARSLMKRIGMRKTVDAMAMTGWHYQQLTKIYASAAMPQECVVILDSDLIAVGQTDASHFMRDGVCALFETNDPDLDAQYYRPWLLATKQFLGLGDDAFANANYVFGPVVWSRTIVRAMIETLERKHGKTLPELFARHKLQSEYFLYGLFARSEPRMQAYYHLAERTLSVEVKETIGTHNFDRIAAAMSDTARYPFLWIHGFVEDRAALLARILDAIARRERAP